MERLSRALAVIVPGMAEAGGTVVGAAQATGPEGSCGPCPLLARVCLPLRGAHCLLLSAQQGPVGQGRPGAWAGGRLSVVGCAVAAVPWTGCRPFLLPAACLWAFGVGLQVAATPVCEARGSMPAGATFRHGLPWDLFLPHMVVIAR